MEQSRSQSYRSSRAAGLRKDMAGQDKVSLAERLIAQGTVCGLILALFLFARCINVPFAVQLRGDIKEALSARSDTEGLADLSNSVKTSFESLKSKIFDNNSKSPDLINDVYDEPSLPDTVPNEGETDVTNSDSENAEPAGDGIATPEVNDSSNIRIDEDILDDINNREDLYLLR